GLLPSLPLLSPRALPPPTATPFPYTTLFRSPLPPGVLGQGGHVRAQVAEHLGIALHRGADPREPDGDPRSGHVLGVDLLVGGERSEEHTSELQSRFDLVCRLLLEKKKTNVAS